MEAVTPVKTGATALFFCGCVRWQAEDVLFDLEASDMFRILLSAILMTCLGCGWARADVTIDNPKHLPINEAEVEILYTIVCQEIADTYHVRNYKNLQVPVTLVLGEHDERYLIDHRTGAGTIYLAQWNEQLFVSSAVMIAFHHVLSDDKFKLEVTKILTRFEKVRPQTVTALRHRP